MFMKRLGIIAILLIGLIIPLTQEAQAAVTWSATSPSDTSNMSDLNPLYDLTNIEAAIFDNDQDFMNFYLNFKYPLSKYQFNDGKESFAAVFLDYNLDGVTDYKLYVADVTLTTDLTTVEGYSYKVSDKSFPACSVRAFTNINAGATWVGIQVSRKCIEIPNIFAMQGYADYNSNDSMSYDRAPTDFFKVTLPGTSTTTITSAATSPTYELPSNIANASTEAANFTQAPLDLTALSESVMPSIVTVRCGNESGSGWSAKVTMSSKLVTEGYKSYVITNHHVIESCLGSKKVSLVLSNKTTVDGLIIAWNENSDVAGIVTKTSIPGTEWIGSAPKQGWWIGVIGSPLGQAGILTTGIISSIKSNAGTFTMTAAINPGNSGGPIFDSTGRILGLATSKNLVSAGVLAEGFGNAQGVTLLCGSIISCVIEKDPWAAISKNSATSTAKAAADLATAKAVADAAAAKVIADKVAADLAAAKTVADAEAAAAKVTADKVAAEKIIADAKAAAEKIIADAKAAVEKAAADLQAKQDAEEKAAAIKSAADSKLALDKALTDLNNANIAQAKAIGESKELQILVEILKTKIDSFQAQVDLLIGQLTVAKKSTVSANALLKKICSVKPKPKGC